MTMCRIGKVSPLAAVLALVIGPSTDFSAAEPSATSREAYKTFAQLIGSWKGTGSPEGTLSERQQGHWVETIIWEWRFKDKEAWLEARFENGKHFTKAELRPKADGWEWAVEMTDKKRLTFAGKLNGGQLVVERRTDDGKHVERLTYSLLHDNRMVYRMDVRPAEGTLFTKRYTVGMTKEGVPFADVGTAANECIVSGGRGTSTVMYEGKTYWVCCSGCRDEFKSDPARYVKEWEAKQKK